MNVLCFRVESEFFIASDTIPTPAQTAGISAQTLFCACCVIALKNDGETENANLESHTRLDVFHISAAIFANGPGKKLALSSK